jgi:hypothetical protein
MYVYNNLPKFIRIIILKNLTKFNNIKNITQNLFVIIILSNNAANVTYTLLDLEVI